MEKILSFIQENNSGNVLFVLKGFHLNSVDMENTNLTKTIENKLTRLMEISGEKASIISYDEFVYIFDFALMQFKKIYILENPIYNFLFPASIDIPIEIASQLLLHFNNDIDETLNDTISLNKITEYLDIYNNFVNIKGTFACSYNIDLSLLKNNKIERITFDDMRTDSIPSDITTTINIYDEQDYFMLAYELSTTANAIHFSYDGFLAGKETIEHKILSLMHIFGNRVKELEKTQDNTAMHCPPEIISLMQKYWGYTSFRDIHIYDLEALKQKNKKVVSISQSQIIGDLVTQVENCVSNKNFRDIFVTAPTGSGKSVMFQLPAMYVAEKYNLLTLVITPLIGLMNDQVEILNSKGYRYARTINSDISPVIKAEILDDVASGNCHILYLSPESLLSRSDIQQLIGDRKIGMIVIDESHIVTTWGKQFRPDYWYLGDHVQKIRRKQSNLSENPSSFIVTTFTATAIYEGNEDMYHETLNSLHMIDPITYLGYVKRDDIIIDIKQVQEKKGKFEYEINKFDNMISMINTAIMRNQKTLIYFPTVALINRFHEYCYSKKFGKYVAKYHGQLTADMKNEGFEQFKNGEKLVMLATKAFGMGIDIPDISIVSHFAPTGNVCDYMQEIGRAARDPEMSGKAIYSHMSNDFKHINRLHGLSALQKYQLIEIIKKVLDIYTSMRYKSQGQPFTKKRNEMLVDAESFGYIFESPLGDDNDNLMNKVKTAMLLIQKDYENRGFAPFYIRPIPLFAYGFFSISPQNQQILNQKYHNAARLIYHPQNICEVNLKEIWDKSFSKSMSFPKFKFMLYTSNEEVKSFNDCITANAMCVDLDFVENDTSIFNTMFNSIKSATNKSLAQGKYYATKEIIDMFALDASISRYRSENIINVLIASMNVYQKDYSARLNIHLYNGKPLNNGTMSFLFNPSIREFFNWLNDGYKYIKDTAENSKIYVENDVKGKRCKEITTLLGILEAFGVLRFKILGGSNSQIYIYVNETKTMQMVKDRPNNYKNKMLETINNRHTESVRMLEYLFQNNLSSDEIWDHLENYFIGILPEILHGNPLKDEIVEDNETILQVQIGDNLKNDYSDWSEVNMMFDNDELLKLDATKVSIADYHSSKFIYGTHILDISLLWLDEKIAVINDSASKLIPVLDQQDWKYLLFDEFTAEELNALFEEV